MGAWVAILTENNTNSALVKVEVEPINYINQGGRQAGTGINGLRSNSG